MVSCMLQFIKRGHPSSRENENQRLRMEASQENAPLNLELADKAVRAPVRAIASGNEKRMLLFNDTVMSLLLQNGEIITASERYVADIWCENETITRIDRNIPPPKGAEVIDAKGKFVFPGFIDPHVHIYLPFM